MLRRFPDDTNCYRNRGRRVPAAEDPRTILATMKRMRASLLVLLAFVAASTAVPAAAQQEGGHAGRPHERPMPPPERRMGWEDRQRLREQVRNGELTRDEARERWRQQRGAEPGRFTPEQRDQLRRDVMDANREMRRR